MDYYKGLRPYPPGAEARMLWEEEQKILRLAKEQEFLQKFPESKPELSPNAEEGFNPDRITFLLFAEKMRLLLKQWPRKDIPIFWIH